MQDILIKNIGLLATPRTDGSFERIKNACVLIKNGLVEYAGPSKDFHLDIEMLDAKQKLLTPGLIDSHTHLVFGAFRQNEIPLKLRGVPYLEILKSGGGILETLKKTREATFEQLLKKSKKHLDEMFFHGVTTCEAKSGYGLDLVQEVKQLEVANRLNEIHPVDVFSTFMGAHAIPEKYKEWPEEYVTEICETMIPYVAKENLALYCDVFCEEGVFSALQSEIILRTAQSYGLYAKIHCDEIMPIGGSVVAGKIKALSAEHLIAVDKKGLESLSENHVIAVLLPATSFYLNKDYAPAKTMKEMKITTVLASDFNPGSCPSNNLQFVMNLGYLKYNFSPEEVLQSVTLNAAKALALKDRGCLEKGQLGDAILWDCEDLEMLVYRFGTNQVQTLIKKGRAYEKELIEC